MTLVPWPGAPNELETRNEVNLQKFCSAHKTWIKPKKEIAVPH